MVTHPLSEAVAISRLATARSYVYIRKLILTVGILLRGLSLLYLGLENSKTDLN